MSSPRAGARSSRKLLLARVLRPGLLRRADVVVLVAAAARRFADAGERT
ncbi:hypothetical protein ACFV7R_46440 [Streptomyces sp. NPDC059866]